MSDTLTSSAVMSRSGGGGGGGGGGVSANPTPSPVVRSNVSTPSNPSLSNTPAPLGQSDSIVGTSLAGRYEVTRKIGEGGMGVVYEARHSLIGKRVAIKVLLDKYAQKADIVARLQQEARLASSIGHEHIVDITDFGETSDGRTFVVMEFLEGESLGQLLAREGPLPPLRAVSIARQVASALDAAHGKGIVHRDIKPENVFIIRRSDRDFVKVVDFGISKAMRSQEDEGGGSSSPRLTHTGMVLGTPLYMSPEQARGEDDLDHRIDVYALGVILYELITGEVPFRGTNYLSIISQVLSQEPTPPSQVRPDLQLSQALETVVLRAMAKDRAVRYQNMNEVDADLAKIEQGDTVLASGAHLAAPRVHKSRRATTLLWVAGIAVIVVATAAALRPLIGKKKGPATAEAAAPPAVETVTVTIDSDGVEHATVFVDNLMKGKTPLDLTLPKGKEIEIRLEADGCTPVTGKVTPAKDGEQFMLKPEKKSAVLPEQVAMVKVKVTSDPPGAAIWLGAADQGKTTPAVLEFPKGNNHIELTFKLAGYADASAPFFPTKDDSLKAKLKKLPKGKVGPPTGPIPEVLPPCPPRNPDVPPSPHQKPCRETSK